MIPYADIPIEISPIPQDELDKQNKQAKLEECIKKNHNMHGYNNNNKNNNCAIVSLVSDQSSLSSAYDSDTDLSNESDESQSSLSIASRLNLREGNIYNQIYKQKKYFLKILKTAKNNSRISTIKTISEEMDHSLEILDNPPLNKKSYLFGAILMFCASFLFSISTTIIKWNHSFGRESFEIFVFRMFIQLFVTTLVASVNVVLNHHYCYQPLSAFSSYETDEGDTEFELTETDYESTNSESDAELGENMNLNGNKLQNKISRRSSRSRRSRMTYKSIFHSILRGQYTCKMHAQRPCCKIRCVYTTIFSEFWRDSSTCTKWYILARGLCGGTGAVCYYWSVAILPINDTIAILSLFPVWSTIFAYFILRERISIKHIISLFLAMFGILLMCYPSFIFGRDDRDDNIYNLHKTSWSILIQGYGFALISSICYGFVFIFIRLAYKAPTFSLIFSNGLFGLLEAIIICIIFHRFVAIPMWRDWLIAIVIGFIGYLAQNTENTAGKYVFVSLSSLIRVTEVFWEFVWQNMVYSKSAGSIATIGATLLVFGIINIMYDKYNDIQNIEISLAKEGELNTDIEYDTDIQEIQQKQNNININHIANYDVKIGAKIAQKMCGVNYQKVDFNYDKEISD